MPSRCAISSLRAGRQFACAQAVRLHFTDPPLEVTGFELAVPPRTTDCWLAQARHPSGRTEASPLPWRGCGFIRHSAGSDPRLGPLSNPTTAARPFGAGTALHAPLLTLGNGGPNGSVGWIAVDFAVKREWLERVDSGPSPGLARVRQGSADNGRSPDDGQPSKSTLRGHSARCTQSETGHPQLST
jgi:hypothetical protein